jgi:hypothetical protein
LRQSALLSPFSRQRESYPDSRREFHSVSLSRRHALATRSLQASLSERLKALEAASIVARCVEPSTPVKVSYGLTERGRELADVLNELQAWAERWTAERASV